ncbi:MAG: hypothetical protein QXW44_07610 [Pyrobaculum sp.]
MEKHGGGGVQAYAWRNAVFLPWLLRRAYLEVVLNYVKIEKDVRKEAQDVEEKLYNKLKTAFEP